MGCVDYGTVLIGADRVVETGAMTIPSMELGEGGGNKKILLLWAAIVPMLIKVATFGFLNNILSQ